MIVLTRRKDEMIVLYNGEVSPDNILAVIKVDSIVGSNARICVITEDKNKVFRPEILPPPQRNAVMAYISAKDKYGNKE